MAFDDTITGTESSKPLDSTPGQETQTPLTPGQDEQSNGAKELGSSLTGEGQRSADRGAVSLTTELEALKMKIFALEKQANGGSATRDSDEVAQDPADPESKKTRPDPISDIEQYGRMEDFLYKHRKEWEMAGVPKSFHMKPRGGDSRQALDKKFGYGPWEYQWHPQSHPDYKRPNPFDLIHQDKDAPGDASEMDEFDIAIDFGGARDRLRKNFEWELDRMFLAEEMGIRRRKKEEDKKNTESKKAEEEERAKTDEQSARPICAQLRLNPVDWYAFKRLSRSEERDSCVIDILIGEPIVNDDVGSGWYGPSGRRVRKVVKSQYLQTTASLTPGQAPLPERIRIHSLVLRKILARILGAEALEVVETNSSAVVLVRPFKALFYREQALRSWCTDLGEKFKQLSKATEHGPADTTSPEGGSDSSQGHDLSQADKVPEKTTTSVQKSIAEDAKDGGDDDDAESDVEEEREEKEDPNDVTRSTMALDHLKCLLNFMDSNISAKQAHLNSPKCSKVFFSDLWYLFRPGVVVIGRDGRQAYRVVNVTSTRHRVVPSWQTWFWNSGDKKKKAPFSITCVYIDFDGKNLGPIAKTFDFKRFEDEMDVTSLPIYPLRFHPLRKADFSESEWKELELFPPEKRYMQKLINRGAKFLEVVGVKAMYYAGPTLGIRDDVESQVVIDFETAFSVDDKKQQEWKPNLEALLGNPVPEDSDDDQEDNVACSAACCRDEFIHDDTYVDLKTRADYVNGLLPKTGGLNEKPSVAIIPQPLGELKNGPGQNDYAVPDDERVIMSYCVFGFVLRSRQWAQLDLSYLTDLHSPEVSGQNNQEDKHSQDNKEKQKYETAFDRLVLEEGQKPMIQALVAQHFRDKESKTGQAAQVDIIKGKGKGLILLLHGAPGVGKTSTAEGVAELFRKPLFQITCGDLGSTAKEVEKALDINFTLANRWDCILLLDEADVFLAQRNKEDFKRNGLVAVFLRVLEYYAGVLFLTTNRVGDFDEAFTSRIHVSLYYPELSKEKTVKVFMINIGMIKERFEDKKRTIVIDDIITFASDHYVNHPQARWNGRQIRNACQTALALAEFEAQGNSHETVLKPNALVHLKLSHFQTVQKAYLEFAKYMNSLYGSNSSTRAKEGKVRAIWIDENDNVVGTQNMGGAFKSRQEAFLHASQGKQQSRSVQPEPQSQQGYQQQVHLQHQQGFQHQAFPPVNQGTPNPGVQQYYQYPNVVAPQPVYAQAPVQMSMQPPQQLYSSQLWNVPGANFVSGSGTGQGEEQNRAPPQLPPTTPLPPQQQPQQQLQASPAFFDPNIQARYAAGSPQGSEQRSPNNLPSTGGGGYLPGPSAPGQQWQGPQGPADDH